VGAVNGFGRRRVVARTKTGAERKPLTAREQIKAIARDALIEKGYRGFSFGDIADALGISRPAVHYHFRSKQQLVEEVLKDYTRDTAQQLRELWSGPAPLVSKIEATARHSHQRYLKYNRTGRTGRPWSLVTQLRQDAAALTPASRHALQQYSRDLNDMIVAAVRDAKTRGEFVDWMPVDDVALQLVSIANSSGAITHDAGSFNRVEQLYSSIARIITLAFGARGAGREERTRYRGQSGAQVHAAR
jgi:AcrR family transcriptional regulator